MSSSNHLEWTTQCHTTFPHSMHHSASPPPLCLAPIYFYCIIFPYALVFWPGPGTLCSDFRDFSRQKIRPGEKIIVAETHLLYDVQASAVMAIQFMFFNSFFNFFWNCSKRTPIKVCSVLVVVISWRASSPLNNRWNATFSTVFKGAFAVIIKSSTRSLTCWSIFLSLFTFIPCVD